MAESFLHQYDRVRVVNLRERTDRRRAVMNELMKLGYTSSESTFFDAYKPDHPGPFLSSGAHGCYLSHAAVISQAAEAGESVLLLEDDCAFRPEASSFLLPKCDVFWGGWNVMENQGDFIIGTHCLGFSRDAVKLLDSYLAGFLENSPDEKASREPGFNPNVRPGIDGVYVWFRRKYPELKTHFANISYQRSSRSDITVSRYDRAPIVKEFVAWARVMKDLFLPGV